MGKYLDCHKIKGNAQKYHYTELTKLLPNRRVGAISVKEYKLGITTISNHTKLDDNSI